MFHRVGHFRGRRPRRVPMSFIRRLQDWCLYLLLVSAGTLFGAMVLIWVGARLGPLAPDPGGPHPMERVVVGLVMAIAATGISYVLLEFAARLLPPLHAATRSLHAATRRARALVGRLSPRGRVLWGIAALALTGLLLDAL
jgi:hypothetical protein